MFKNVVVGSDARTGGRDALALAAALTQEDASIVLARVYDGDLNLPPAPTIPDDAPAARRLSTEMVPANTTGHGLHRLAERLGADLVVVGSSTRGRWARLVFGDDVRQCVRDAPCAVAIAPQGFAEHGGTIATVGVGWDDSPAALAALGAARAVADAHDGTVELLQVVVMPAPVLAPGTYPHIELENDIERAQERLDGIDGVTGKAILGTPENELAQWSHGFDLLAVGATPHGLLGRILAGSVAEQLTRSVAAPLLVVPAAA